MVELNGKPIIGIAHWKMVKLGDVAKYINGKAFKPSDWKTSGLPIIRIQNLNNPDAKFNYCDQPVDKKYYVNSGDLLFAWSGTPGSSFGAHLWKGGKAVLNQHIFRIEINEDKVNKLYFQHTLNYKIKEFVAKAHGTAGLAHITKSKFEISEILLPPIVDQQQIVTKLEELFSELDKSIEGLKTAQQQLKVYRQSVLKWAFEGRLTNEEVKEGELPNGWKWIKTKDVIDTINNGYTPAKQHLSERNGEVPFIKVYNLNFDGTLNFSKNPTFIPETIHKKDLKRSICYPGDVLINIVGPPLGKVSIVTHQFPEWNINQAVVLFRPNEKVLSKYLSFYMQCPSTIHWLEGTSKATAGQFNIKVSTCREIPIPIPLVKEQEEVIQEIESRLSVADKVEETIVNSLEQAEALRQSILKKAFEGKLI